MGCVAIPSFRHLRICVAGSQRLVLVVGAPHVLPHPVAPTERLHEVGRKFDVAFSRLMQQFDDVQFLGSYRVASFVAWARAQNGEPKRLFGEQTLDVDGGQKPRKNGGRDRGRSAYCLRGQWGATKWRWLQRNIRLDEHFNESRSLCCRPDPMRGRWDGSGGACDNFLTFVAVLGVQSKGGKLHSRNRPHSRGNTDI